MKQIVAIVAAILLLPIAAFCVFGFMATFEPTDQPEVFVTFRIGYGIVGIGCLAGVVGLIGWAFLSRRIREHKLRKGRRRWQRNPSN